MPSDLLCCEVVLGNLRGRLCWQISFVCKIVMGNLRRRLCSQILFMQHGYAAKPRVHANMVVRKAHMLSMTPMWKDHGRLSRQIFRGSCGYSSEAREALPQNRGCSQAHSRTSEPNRIGSVEAVHKGRKTRRITWSAALAEYEGNLWNIFYNGIDHKYKLSLDTASNGNFMTKSVPEAKLLIENLAASDANACPDYNRSVKTTSSSESAQISELRNMVSQLLKAGKEFTPLKMP
ncbi:unnamed protein product [Microthlaspi erraticum]|uniref:Uncharacterized protein n=1 Tax=Microthlaspi erraticum TaxID=1685480 RepID=A0A6D2JMK4_9BRAS|nr:unnamed protein product [Microthlaspi erraticum]